MYSEKESKSRQNKSKAKPTNTYYTTILYTEDTYVEDGFVDTWYYRNTDFRFCDSIQNEKLFGVKDVFKAQPNETKITMYISQYDKLWLKTDRMSWQNKKQAWVLANIAADSLAVAGSYSNFAKR